MYETREKEISLKQVHSEIKSDHCGSSVLADNYDQDFSLVGFCEYISAVLCNKPVF